MINLQYLIYAMIAVAVAIGAQATYQYLSSSRSYRRSVNSRLKISGQIGDVKTALAELRRKRSLSPEGQYILPIIWLNRLVMQSGVSIDARSMLVLMFGLAATTYAATHYILGRGLIFSCAMALVLGFGLPLQFLRISRDRRIKQFESQLPDGIDAMVRGLRAGHPVSVALETVAREAPDPLGSEFGMAFDEVAYGLDIETSMANMRARVGQVDLGLLVVAVSLQSKTGGNLAEILASLTKVLRERFRMQRKVRALSAEGRFSAIGLSILPIFVSSLVFLTAPTFYTAVWDDPLFMPIATFGTLLLVSGDYIMFRMVRFRW
jgi:tight adherence protein B